MNNPISRPTRHLGFCLLLSVLILLLTTCDAASRITNFVIPEETQVRREHKTHLFRSNSWYILRRANHITFRVTLDEALNDNQQLSFQVAPYAIIDGSTIRINHISGGVYDITGYIPPDAPVGTFALGIRLSDQTQTRQLPKQIALLLNPYSPEDLVYYPRQDELKEYVEQEHGITYRGTDRQVQDVRWYYANFSHECLAVLLYALNKIGEKERRDPALIARFLTKFSSQQESMPDGLMVGKWEGSFAGGTNPSSWQSSDQILRTYLNQGYRSVRFSQCWVFAAVYQSLARAAGFATAQISNFNSVHEYSAEREGIYMQRIGRYWERDRRFMLAETGKVWNYHSWNVVFFQNIHAPHPYNLPDWQVVDPTPQELSEGVFQMGPGPLRAIRDGRKINFDTSFIMSEVTSRYHNFLASCQYGYYGGNRLPPGCKVVQDLGADPNVPSGTYIVAKAVGGFFQQSWTHLYHTRVRGDDEAYLRRFNAVRAFDVFNAPVNRRGRSLLPSPDSNSITDEDEYNISTSRNISPFNTFSTTTTTTTPRQRDMTILSLPGVHDIRDDPVYNNVNVFDLHDDDDLDIPAILTSSSLASTGLDEIAIYQYPDTGIALSITIPPVKLGEPLELYLNFVCEGNTLDYDKQLRRRDLPSRVITLNVENHHDITGITTDDDEDEDDNALLNNNYNDDHHGSGNVSGGGGNGPDDITYCPSIAMISFRVQLEFTDYTTRHIAEIIDIDSHAILHQTNGYFQSYRIVVNDYIEKANIPQDEMIPEYIRAVVMATDHSTNPSQDIIMFATHTAMVQFPTIQLLTPTTNLIIKRSNTFVIDSNSGSTTTATAVGGDVNTQDGTPSTTVAAPAATVITPNVGRNDHHDHHEHPVHVSIIYQNELPIAMTNVKITITADNFGFNDQVITLPSIDKYGKLHHIHTFDATDSIDGLHLYNVVLESDQLAPIRAQLEFHINTPQ